MPKVFPFRGLHFNPKTTGNLSDLISPPYDVIKPDLAEKLKAKSPYNFARLILPQEANDDYSRASQMLQKWRTNDILSQDPAPVYYLYSQTFDWKGKTHIRNTLMASVELTEFGKGEIRPHENTHGKYKADRLQILRKTKANLSHIFGMVRDEVGTLQTHYEEWMYHAPLLSATDDDGVKHSVWRADVKHGAFLTEFFEKHPIYIVDGHHRYESSLMYARETGALGNLKNPASQMLFAIANCYDPALLVLPTHRRVKNVGPETLKQSAVEERFYLTPVDFNQIEKLTETPSNEPQFGLYAWDKLFLCRPKAGEDKKLGFGPALSRLAVAWSDDGLLKSYLGIQESDRSARITYERDAGTCWKEREPNDLIIFHAPPIIETITDIADENGFMPQKSTYFYPKLAAGLVLRDVSE